jgi:cell pole-organizing protein PopZ
MSDAKGQQNEPSMEEILASIRRIIAEDGDAPAADAAAPAPTPAPSAPAMQAAPAPASPQHAPDDILELTDVVGADGTVVNLNAAKAAPEPPRQAPPPPEPRQYVEFEPAAAPQDERIVSPHTAAAAVGAFSQIAALRDDARARDIGLGAGHLTLETIVREELRQILRAWLDANLPNMVERLVQQEISRLVSDVQRR